MTFKTFAVAPPAGFSMLKQVAMEWPLQQVALWRTSSNKGEEEEEEKAYLQQQQQHVSYAERAVMSWVKAASKSEDDIFEENADELRLLGKEWEANMKRRIRDGYVDGADAGEEAALAEGFSEGFREGAARTVAVGRLRGIVSAIGSWHQIQHPDHPIPTSVKELLQRVSQHEQAIIDHISKTMENPPPRVEDVSQSMEHLEVALQAGPAGGCQNSDCCKKVKLMDTESPFKSDLFHSACSASSSACEDEFGQLLQRCGDLVSEMELPLELLEHIEELKNLAMYGE